VTLPKNKQLDQNEIDSMKVAVEEYDIRAIHPDKMEDFAEYLLGFASAGIAEANKISAASASFI